MRLAACVHPSLHQIECPVCARIRQNVSRQNVFGNRLLWTVRWSACFPENCLLHDPQPTRIREDLERRFRPNAVDLIFIGLGR